MGRASRCGSSKAWTGATWKQSLRFAVLDGAFFCQWHGNLKSLQRVVAGPAWLFPFVGACSFMVCGTLRLRPVARLSEMKSMPRTSLGWTGWGQRRLDARGKPLPAHCRARWARKSSEPVHGPVRGPVCVCGGSSGRNHGWAVGHRCGPRCGKPAFLHRPGTIDFWTERKNRGAFKIISSSPPCEVSRPRSDRDKKKVKGPTAKLHGATATRTGGT